MFFIFRKKLRSSALGLVCPVHQQNSITLLYFSLSHPPSLSSTEPSSHTLCADLKWGERDELEGGWFGEERESELRWRDIILLVNWIIWTSCIKPKFSPYFNLNMVRNISIFVLSFIYWKIEVNLVLVLTWWRC